MENKYGILLNDNIKLYRKWFEEMTTLIGINVIYQAPTREKTYTEQSEIVSSYQDKEVVGCIFDEHPTQQTLKKLNWASELQKGASIIHVPYDLHDLQQGALFYLPSGLDNASFRLFRVTKLSNIMVYPASIACEVVPEYENTLPSDAIRDFRVQNFTLLRPEED